MNDAEKGALRLEVEKLRRTEGEWVQVVVRVLGRILLLHNAAARSGQPELAAQIDELSERLPRCRPARWAYAFCRRSQ